MLLKDEEDQTRYQSFWKIFRTVLCYNLGSFYFGYSIMYFNSVDFQDIYSLYHINMEKTKAQGIYSGATFIGACFGTIVTNLLITKLSRIQNFYFINFIGIVAGILVLVQNTYTLLIGRVLQGLTFGMYTSIIALMVKEYSPVQISGYFGTFKLLLCQFGFLFAFCLAYVLEKVSTFDRYCQILFGFPLLINFIQQILLMTVYNFQTPKYYLMEGRIEEWKALLSEIYKQEYLQEIFDQKLKDLQVEKEHLQRKQKIQEPKDDPIAIFLAFFLAVFQQLTITNIFNLYIRDMTKQIYPSLWKQSGIIINLLRLFGIFGLSFFIDNFGRKNILILGSFLMSILAIVMSILVGRDSQQVGVFTLIVIILYLIVFSFSLSPIIWLYIPQIIQPSMIPKTIFSLWFSAFCTVTLFPILTNGKNEITSGLCLGVGIGLFLGMLIILKYMVQSKQKTQLQIREEFNMKKIC